MKIKKGKNIMVQNQSYLFLVFTLTGVIIGILFDFFRILRKIIKTGNIITYIEDILFWILTGMLVLYNIWYFNNGEIRIYMFLGIIIGVIIYISTLSDILIRLFAKILSTIMKALKLPFRGIIGFFRRVITLILSIFTKYSKKNKIKKGNFVNNGE